MRKDVIWPAQISGQQGLGRSLNSAPAQEHKQLHALQVPALALHICACSRAYCRRLLLVAPLRFLFRIACFLEASFVRAFKQALRGRPSGTHGGAATTSRRTAVAGDQGGLRELLATTMADNKRQSMVGKVATPNLKAGGVANKDVGDADSNLYKAVGSRYAPLA